MVTETCGICEAQTSLRHTVHVMINTKSDDGVVDYYVCRSCYEDDIEPLFPDLEPS